MLTFGRGGAEDRADTPLVPAIDLASGRPVELRLLPASATSDISRYADVLAAVGRATQVGSPYLARVVGLGQLEGTPALAFEAVPGTSLAEQVRSHGPIGWPDVAMYLRQIATGLSRLHGSGLVHGNLTSSTVRLPQPGSAVLTDLGLHASLAPGEVTSRPASWPLFAPPEGVLDPRSDLYSLGVVALELATGPIDGAVPAPLVDARAEQLRGLPEAARRLLVALLAAEPSQRPQSAESLIDQLGTAPAGGIGPAGASLAPRPAGIPAPPAPLAALPPVRAVRQLASRVEQATTEAIEERQAKASASAPSISAPLVPPPAIATPTASSAGLEASSGDVAPPASVRPPAIEVPPAARPAVSPGPPVPRAQPAPREVRPEWHVPPTQPPAEPVPPRPRWAEPTSIGRRYDYDTPSDSLLTWDNIKAVAFIVVALGALLIAASQGNGNTGPTVVWETAAPWESTMPWETDYTAPDPFASPIDAADPFASDYPYPSEVYPSDSFGPDASAGSGAVTSPLVASAIARLTAPDVQLDATLSGHVAYAGGTATEEFTGSLKIDGDDSDVAIGPDLAYDGFLPDQARQVRVGTSLYALDRSSGDWLLSPPFATDLTFRALFGEITGLHEVGTVTQDGRTFHRLVGALPSNVIGLLCVGALGTEQRDGATIEIRVDDQGVVGGIVFQTAWSSQTEVSMTVSATVTRHDGVTIVPPVQ